MLFTCIKSRFFRNHLANFHQISHWSFCWNVIDSLFKWSCSIDCQAHIFFFKTKNCSNDDIFISCDDRIGKMLHNICMSAVAMSLRWANRGPWASCFHQAFVSTFYEHYYYQRAEINFQLFSKGRPKCIGVEKYRKYRIYISFEIIIISPWQIRKTSSVSLLTFTTILANSTDDELIILGFPKKIGFEISCKLSPTTETVCMKCQILFMGKKEEKKKYFKMSSAVFCSMLCVNMTGNYYCKNYFLGI